jgi:hypothetical protein
MTLFRRLFIDHPASVGETYVEHLITASRFGAKMVFAGAACIIHGVLPAIFKTRGSDAICVLHERMVVNRRKIPKQRLPSDRNLTERLPRDG